MKVTAQKIAREAGVSETTVSLVLNGRPTRISEQTKKRVLDVAKKFNYKSNQIAVSLATQRTKTLGLVLPNLPIRFFHVWRLDWKRKRRKTAMRFFCAIAKKKLSYSLITWKRCSDAV